MSILIIDQRDSQFSKSVELTDGKKTARVSISKSDGRINVCCQNASHRVWLGMGRFFKSWEAAAEGYKSAPMRSLIRAAKDELSPLPGDTGFANAAAVTLAHHIWFRVLENHGNALAHENKLLWFVYCNFGSASAIQSELAKAGIAEPAAAWEHFERLRTAAEPQRDSQVVVGKQPRRGATWAKKGDWMAKHWPDGGGTEAYVNVEGLGWVVDANDEMPHETWIELLRAVGAPLADC